MKDNDRLGDAQVPYAVANQLWPKNRATAFWLAKIVDKQFNLTAQVADVPFAHAELEWWKTPAGREANLLKVQKINEENRRLIEAQQHRWVLPSPSRPPPLGYR